MLAVAAWIVIDVLLAACTADDDGDFSRFGKVAMFVLVVLIWSVVFLPLSVLQGED